MTDEMKVNLREAEQIYKNAVKDIATERLKNKRAIHRRLGKKPSTYFCNL